MPTGTMNYTGELTITTCWCGTVHAVPKELHDYQMRCHHDGKNVPDIYCPLGHVYVPAGKPKWRSERERAEAAELDAANAREDARIALARVGELEAEATRQRKRSAAGVCPCCNRSFVQLARHMKAKHPEHAK